MTSTGALHWHGAGSSKNNKLWDDIEDVIWGAVLKGKRYCRYDVSEPLTHTELEIVKGMGFEISWNNDSSFYEISW